MATPDIVTQRKSSRFQLLLDKVENADDVAVNSPACCDNLEQVFQHHACLKGLVFITLLTLCLLEGVTDWLLYIDISRLEHGMVYGPVSPVIPFIMMIVCMIGSLWFLFEISNLIRGTCGGTAWVNLELVAALSVWLDDIPIMIISLLIALCHSEPISYFQLIKNCLAVLCAIIRLLCPIARAYIKKTEKPPKTRTKVRNTIFRAVTSFGICLLLCGSITIFIFTHVIASDNGKLEFRLPQDIWTGKVAEEKYFKEVGIYFLHSDLDRKRGDKQYWIKLAAVFDFKETKNIHVKLTYIENGGFIQKLSIRSYNTSGQIYHECYNFPQDSAQIQMSKHQTCTRRFILDTEGPKELIFKFVYHPPRLHLLVGDITYNCKYLYNSVCYEVSSAPNTTDLGFQGVQLGQLTYMKHETLADENHRLVQGHSNQTTEGTSPEFTTQHFLREIKDIWLTGFIGCKCTGRLGPTFNKTLLVSC